MNLFFEKLLKGFDYHSWLEFGQSVVPSTKYSLTICAAMISGVFPPLDRLFGLDGYAFVALLIVFLTELATGVGASFVRKEPLSSMKLSRFTFKLACYLVLIFVPYVMSLSFKERGSTLAATIFDWLHIFLVIQIVLENIVSILENLSVLSGKDKTHWISKIQTKINGLLE